MISGSKTRCTLLSSLVIIVCGSALQFVAVCCSALQNDAGMTDMCDNDWLGISMSMEIQAGQKDGDSLGLASPRFRPGVFDKE